MLPTTLLLSFRSSHSPLEQRSIWNKPKPTCKYRADSRLAIRPPLPSQSYPHLIDFVQNTKPPLKWAGASWWSEEWWKMRKKTRYKNYNHITDYLLTQLIITLLSATWNVFPCFHIFFFTSTFSQHFHSAHRRVYDGWWRRGKLSAIVEECGDSGLTFFIFITFFHIQT